MCRSTEADYGQWLRSHRWLAEEPGTTARAYKGWVLQARHALSKSLGWTLSRELSGNLYAVCRVMLSRYPHVMVC